MRQEDFNRWVVFVGVVGLVCLSIILGQRRRSKKGEHRSSWQSTFRLGEFVWRIVDLLLGLPGHTEPSVFEAEEALARAAKGGAVGQGTARHAAASSSASARHGAASSSTSGGGDKRKKPKRGTPAASTCAVDQGTLVATPCAVDEADAEAVSAPSQSSRAAPAKPRPQPSEVWPPSASCAPPSRSARAPPSFGDDGSGCDDGDAESIVTSDAASDGENASGSRAQSMLERLGARLCHDIRPGKASASDLDALAALSSGELIDGLSLWDIVSKRNRLHVSGVLRGDESAGTSEALGFAVHRMQQQTLQVLYLGVCAAERRKGVGTVLLMGLRDLARQHQQCTTLFALVPRGEVEGQAAFWSSVGFKHSSPARKGSAVQLVAFSMKVRNLSRAEKLAERRRKKAGQGAPAQVLSWQEVLSEARRNKAGVVAKGSQVQSPSNGISGLRLPPPPAGHSSEGASSSTATPCRSSDVIAATSAAVPDEAHEEIAEVSPEVPDAEAENVAAEHESVPEDCPGDPEPVDDATPHGDSTADAPNGEAAPLVSLADVDVGAKAVVAPPMFLFDADAEDEGEGAETTTDVVAGNNPATSTNLNGVCHTIDDGRSASWKPTVPELPEAAIATMAAVSAATSSAIAAAKDEEDEEDEDDDVYNWEKEDREMQALQQEIDKQEEELERLDNLLAEANGETPSATQTVRQRKTASSQSSRGRSEEVAPIPIRQLGGTTQGCAWLPTLRAPL